MSFTVDGTALKSYSWSFDQARDLSTERVPGGTHYGYVAGGMRPTLKITVEEELYATYNAYTKRGSAATAALILGWNQATQYNRFKMTAPQAQLINVTRGGKGKIGTMELEFLLTPSTPVLNDGHSWVAD